MFHASWYTSNRNFLKQRVIVVIAVERRFTTDVLQNLFALRRGSGRAQNIATKRTAISTESGKDRREKGGKEGQSGDCRSPIELEEVSRIAQAEEVATKCAEPPSVFSRTWLSSRAGCRNTAPFSLLNCVLEREYQCSRSPELESNRSSTNVALASLVARLSHVCSNISPCGSTSFTPLSGSGLNCTRICTYSGKLLLKNSLSTPDQDSNLDLPVIGSLVYCKSSVLDHAVTEAGQLSVRRPEMVVWCTISIEEQWKCQNFSQAIERDFALFGNDEMRLNCTKAFNKEDCMAYLDEEKAQITSLDAGEVFVGGRYHSLVPIMQELYSGRQKFYHAVAVVKKGGTMADVRSLHDLRGKRACFAEVGTLAGWVIPIFTGPDGNKK
uniref:Transferrin-like domain-containing protein n=1 Tax=Timema poppense TaxID=170557 RepID=A0A7R9D8B0_TIMPO|nr:unnamed protein product [Timema poppensis]